MGERCDGCCVRLRACAAVAQGRLCCCRAGTALHQWSNVGPRGFGCFVGFADALQLLRLTLQP